MEFKKILPFLLLIFVIGINNICYAAPTTLDFATMKSILEELEISKSDENITSMVEKFNAWITYQTQDLNKDFDLGNILFYKSAGEPNILKFLIVNMGRGSDELHHLYIDTSQSYYSNYIWTSWKKNTSSGAIVGVNTNGVFSVWYCVESKVDLLGSIYIDNDSYGKMKAGYTNNNSALYLNYAVAYPGALIFARTQSYGYNTYSLTHTYDVSTIMPTPTPTATPTVIPSSPVLNDISNKIDTLINKIDDVNSNLTSVPSDLTDNTTVTADDIKNSLDFQLVVDPYANFWAHLLNGIQDSFINKNETFDINWFDHIYTINVNDVVPAYPLAFKQLLTIVSTVVLAFPILKYIKETVDLISSGSADELLEMNEEEGYIDMF